MSRLIVGGGGGGTGGQGDGPGFYCTQLPQNGRAYNQQRPLPGGNPSQGPVPIMTATGLVIPGENADYNYGAIKDVTAAQGGSTTPGAGGSLSTRDVYEVNNGNVLSAVFSPTVPGGAASGPSGGAGASVTGTNFATPEGPNDYLPGAGGGGGGGGGYTGGGGGSAGYVCTYSVNASPTSDCYNPSAAMGGGGGSSFASGTILAPFIDSGPFASGSVTFAPILEINSPTNGAVYSLGEVVDAQWSCGGAGSSFQGTSCSSATDNSGSPIDTTPGQHTFTVTVNPIQSGPSFTVSVSYTVSSAANTGTIQTHGRAGGTTFTLTSPRQCLAPNSDLALRLGLTGVLKRYRVARYSYSIGRGVAHDKRVIRAGKRRTLTFYTPNLVATSAGPHKIPLRGLIAGAHKLKLVVLLRSTDKTTRTKQLTLTVRFSIC